MFEKKYAVRVEDSSGGFWYYDDIGQCDLKRFDYINPVSFRKALKILKECENAKIIDIRQEEKNLQPLVVNDIYIIDGKKLSAKEEDFFVWADKNGYVVKEGKITDKIVNHKTCRKILFEKWKKVRENEADFIDFFLIKKEDFEKLVNVEPGFCYLFKPKYIKLRDTNLKGRTKHSMFRFECENKTDFYITKKEFDKVVDEIKKEHKPYVIKDTDHPYYFKLNGEFIPSEIKSWYEFVKTKTGFVDDFMYLEINE